MTILILCNIGNRDIQVTPWGKPQLSARPHGQAILDALEQKTLSLADIQLPIAAPALAYIRGQWPGKTMRLIFFGTDQPFNHNARDVSGIPFRDKDTCTYAQVAQQVVQQHPQLAFNEVLCRAVPSNPSLYDETMDAYERLLVPLVQEEIVACYLIPVGGTPACNTAMLIQGIRLFGDKCRTVYVPENGSPHELAVGTQVLSVMREKTIQEYLAHYNFAAASPLLARHSSNLGLWEINQYAQLRFDFDFAAAQNQLQHALNDGKGPVRAFTQTLRHDLENLLTGDELALIAEVYHNAVICWDNHRYVDFLGRVFRLHEAVLRYLVNRLYGLDPDAGDRQKRAAFRAYLTNHPALETYLRAQHQGDGFLQYKKISRPVLMAFVRYALTPQPPGITFSPDLDAARLQHIYAILERIEQMGNLRNKTILAHGYAGVSQDIIRDAYDTNQPATQRPLDGLQELCQALNLPLLNPFAKIRDFILSQLSSPL